MKKLALGIVHLEPGEGAKGRRMKGEKCKMKREWDLAVRRFAGRMKVVVCILLWLVLGAGPLAAQEITLTASIDRNPVGLYDQFTYTLEIKGASSGYSEPKLPDFSDFRVMGGPNVSTSVQIVNGAYSASKIYSVILLPRKTGDFTFPAVAISFKGKNYQSNPIQVTVIPQSAAPAQGGAGAAPGDAVQAAPDELFLRAIPSRRSVYVNDQVTVVYKLYFRNSVQGLDYLKLPETVGFWVEEYEIPQTNIPVTQETVNGVRYNVAEIKRMALFPTKSGELAVTPMQLAVNVVERRRRRDPLGSFDDFFSDPFGRTVRKVVASEPLAFNVKPLPSQGKPANFSGLVGNFLLKVDVDKTEVKANEAISYKVRLSGSGNLKSLSKLPIEFPPSFEVYEPKVNDAVNRSGSSMTASRELEYVLIPRTSGQYRIKPLEISYFDPASETYKTLQSPEFALSVGEGKELPGMAGSSYLAKSEVKLLGKDIFFIKEENLRLQPLGYKPYRTPWFWAALILPLIFLGLAYGYRTHQEKMTTNLEYARQRKAYKQAEKRLKGASHFLKQRMFGEFYGEVSRSLIGFVADKTNRPAAGMVRQDVEKLLANKNVDAALVADYLNCLDEADFRRFAPAQATEEEAKSFYHRAEEILVRLGKYF